MKQAKDIKEKDILTMKDIKEKDILTMDEIDKLENINSDMVNKYLKWGEQHLADCLQTKIDIEKKSLGLFLSYTINFITLIFMNLQFNINFFYIPQLCFAIGLICLLLSMNFCCYGTLGKNPSCWLNKSIDYNYLIINKADEVYIIAYRVRELVNRIKVSDKSNNYKMKLIQASLVAGALGLIGLFFG